MIIVNCALRQQDIINVVEAIQIQNNKPFKFIKKQGIKIFFNTDYENLEEACTVIKKEIKSQTYGNALYFNVITD